MVICIGSSPELPVFHLVFELERRRRSAVFRHRAGPRGTGDRPYFVPFPAPFHGDRPPAARTPVRTAAARSRYPVWLPSQNGLFFDFPHWQSVTRFLTS